jgi:hypothetical protein
MYFAASGQIERIQVEPVPVAEDEARDKARAEIIEYLLERDKGPA